MKKPQLVKTVMKRIVIVKRALVNLICYKFYQVMKIRAPVMRMRMRMRMRTVDILDLAPIKVRRVIAVKMKVMRMTVLKVRAVKVETVINTFLFPT